MSEEDEDLGRISRQKLDREFSRRQKEIRDEIQKFNREKKKFSKEKLQQEVNFLENEINELTNLIERSNREIIELAAKKKKITIDLNHLWAGAQVRPRNLSIALREKLRYEKELKKPNKNQNYRDLALKNIEQIDAAMPTLRENEKLESRFKQLDVEQRSLEKKRNKLSELRNRSIERHTQTKKMIIESEMTIDSIEQKIEDLRLQSEKLKMEHEREIQSASQNSVTNSTKLDDEEQRIDDVRRKMEIFLNYLREKQTEHCLWSNSNKTQPTKETKIEKLSSDILDKYGGLTKPEKSPHKRKEKRSQRRLSHSSQMIHLHDEIRRSMNDTDRFPAMPMFQWDLYATIKTLESIRETLGNSSNSLERNQFDIPVKFDRQISDEGYRSVGFDSTLTQSPSVYRRSKSDQSNDKVHRWLYESEQLSQPHQLISLHQNESIDH